MTCTHDIIEKDNACADGMCPICLAADNEYLRAEVHRLMQALVDAPVTGSSSQLLGVAAHRLQEALGEIQRLEAERDYAVRDVVRGAEKIKQLREELELVSK